MKEDKKYPCEQCAFGIYTVERKWWCDLYDVYAPQVARNISEPCSHILALYLISSKFLKLKLDINKEYKINDIMETLL